MFRILLALTLAAPVHVALFAQAPAAQAPRPAAPAAPAPQTPRPAQPAPAAPGTPPATPAAPRPAPRPAAATSLSFQVTDGVGAPLSNVQVTTQAPVAREGVTGPDGLLRLANMRAGTYRFHFEREGSITLERDVTVRNGESLTIDVSLNAAPVVKAPEVVKPAEPEPAVKPMSPPGDPKVVPIPLFLEKNFIGKDGRKDSALGCTSTATATLHQLREAWLPHSNEPADEWIYVVAGEGTLRIGTADQRVSAGTFSLIPRTVSHALLPTGRNPLIVISILSGPPCSAP